MAGYNIQPNDPRFLTRATPQTPRTVPARPPVQRLPPISTQSVDNQPGPYQPPQARNIYTPPGQAGIGSIYNPASSNRREVSSPPPSDVGMWQVSPGNNFPSGRNVYGNSLESNSWNTQEEAQAADVAMNGRGTLRVFQRPDGRWGLTNPHSPPVSEPAPEVNAGTLTKIIRAISGLDPNPYGWTMQDYTLAQRQIFGLGNYNMNYNPYTNPEIRGQRSNAGEMYLGNGMRYSWQP